MIKKCSGCGAKLQNTDPSKIGYIPKMKNKNPKLCERCFKIIHYNDAKVVSNIALEKKIIKIVNDSNNYVLFLIDFLNINSQTINIFNEINRPKTLIISKSDIIPSSLNQNKIISWLHDYYQIKTDIIFISSHKHQNINLIYNYLLKNKIKITYLLGFTNVGKSSLVNSIISLVNLNHDSITTSLVPNTTLDFMNIKINDNLTIIDSPGFTLKDNIYNLDDLNFVKKINPKKFLKPVTYQLKENDSIMIEDKIRIDNLNIKNNLTFYFSNDIKIMKIYHKEYLKNEDKIYLEVPKDSDIVIMGLGFINVKKDCKLNMYIHNPKLIEVRKSFFIKN